MNIVSAVILCTIVGAVGAIVLVAAAKFMAVEEDPRIEEVSACLAGANCGGCGYAGCADYAKAVVPVSYTHLDVYKRQLPGWGATRGTATSTKRPAAAGICSAPPRCRTFPL